ncbi:MAG: hypothetical protein U1E65_08860 [Myxococcota bacterium]
MRALFERRELQAALDLLVIERQLEAPAPARVLLELVCRSALGQGEAAELLRGLCATPGAPPELLACAAWLPEGKESAAGRAALEDAAVRMVPRLHRSKGRTT